MYSNTNDPREKQEQDVSRDLQNDNLDETTSSEDEMMEEFVKMRNPLQKKKSRI